MSRIKSAPLSYCALCENQITKPNASNDHIILNSFGGRRKVKNFTCKNCDNRCGHRWDAALAKQLNPLNLLLKIARERKGVPSQVFETTKGEKITFHSDGHMTLSKPDVQEKQVGDLVELEINARSSKEAREIATGFKRKYPNLDIEELMRKAEVKSYKLKDALKISVSFGIGDSGRSIVKYQFLQSPRVSIFPLDEETAERYAVILNTLWAAGTPIPTNDLWIAATAMQYGLEIVTTDLHFQKVVQVLVRHFSLPPKS